MARHQVDFVVVGGWAIEVQMAAEGTAVPYPPTQDIDIAPRQELGNLARLSDALRELSADIYSTPGHTAEFIRRNGHEVVAVDLVAAWDGGVVALDRPASGGHLVLLD